MLRIPAAAEPLFSSLSVAFSRPTFQRVVLLVLGAIVTPGRRTVAAVLRTMRPLVRGHFSSYHRVLSGARWSLWAAGRALARAVLAHVPEGQPVVLAVDDTVARHRGPKVYGRGCHGDPLQPRHHGAVLGPPPGRDGGHGPLPLRVTPLGPAGAGGAVPQPRAVRAACSATAASRRTNWRGSATATAAASRSSPASTTTRACTPCRRQTCRRQTRSAAAGGAGRPSAAPSSRAPGKPSPPRPASPAPPSTGTGAGGATWTCSAPPAGGTATAAGWCRSAGRSCDRAGIHRDEYFAATDPALAPEQIVGLYTGRRPIETTFQEAREHLGLETPRQRCERSVLRTTPCLLGLFSVVCLAFAAHARRHPRARTPANAAAWYAKAEPTFSDAMATVRRLIWEQTIIRRRRGRRGQEKWPTHLRELLLDCLARAA